MIKLHLKTHTNYFENISEATKYYKDLKERFGSLDLTDRKSVNVDIVEMEDSSTLYPNKPLYFVYDINMVIKEIRDFDIIDVVILKQGVEYEIYKLEAAKGFRDRGIYLKCIDTVTQRIEELEKSKQTLIEELAQVEKDISYGTNKSMETLKEVVEKATNGNVYEKGESNGL